MDFQFLELSLQLLGFLPPLGPAFTHIVHTILEAFGLGLQVLVLALPTIPTPALTACRISRGSQDSTASTC